MESDSFLTGGATSSEKRINIFAIEQKFIKYLPKSRFWYVHHKKRGKG
jgi:hypothetical protein